MVIGLGLVGQLVVQLLVASGALVVGLDLDQDRCRLAEKAGAVLCAAQTTRARRGRAGAVEGIGRPGADRVFLVAGGSSNQPVELAARLAATGPRSSTSASASSTCHGTTTTRRNSTSGSPDRTDRALRPQI